MFSKAFAVQGVSGHVTQHSLPQAVSLFFISLGQIFPTHLAINCRPFAVKIVQKLEVILRHASQGTIVTVERLVKLLEGGVRARQSVLIQEVVVVEP